MSQAPSMPVFVDALVGDTLHLSAEQFGAYCLLLFATWRNNGRPLTDDNEVLARICRLTLPAWRKMRPTLSQFFSISDGTWRQKRLEQEWDYVTERAKRARENGNLGGRPKRTQDKPNGLPVGTPERTQEQSTQSQPQVSDLIGREPIRVRNEILKIIGGNPEDPKWHSGVARVEMWLAENISPELVIFPAIRRYAAKPGPGFPHNFPYLEKVVFSYAEELKRPLPEMTSGTATRTPKLSVAERIQAVVDRNTDPGEIRTFADVAN